MYDSDTTTTYYLLLLLLLLLKAPTPIRDNYPLDFIRS